jgi:glycosyltransferase involved in cell wall biosynthesis
LNNKYPSECIEIIVVDNGSQDSSSQVAESLGAHVLKIPGKRVSELRNIGATQAHAMFLAFVDSDHILAPGWIVAALECLQMDEQIAGVGASCSPPCEGTWVQHAYDRLREHPHNQKRILWLGAGNMAVTKIAFAKVGGFDIHLETCEDVDICKRFHKAGYGLIHDSRMISAHMGDPSTLKSLFLGEMWRGRNNLKVSFHSPLSFREIATGITPIIESISMLCAILTFIFEGAKAFALFSLAITPLLILPTLRAILMSNRSQKWQLKLFLQNVAIAFTYDMGRACALFAFASHRLRRL